MLATNSPDFRSYTVLFTVVADSATHTIAQLDRVAENFMDELKTDYPEEVEHPMFITGVSTDSIASSEEWDYEVEMIIHVDDARRLERASNYIFDEDSDEDMSGSGNPEYDRRYHD